MRFFASCSLLACLGFLFLCNAPIELVSTSVSAQENDLEALSEEEARQIQIAERFVGVLEKRPRRGTALERVYGHHVEFGTLDAFIQGLRDRVKDNPNEGAGWMMLGLFESQRGEDADAAEAFAKAEEHLPEDGMPAYYMGQSLILIGQPEKAVDAFERAIARKPRRTDLLEIFQQLGRVHQRGQRTEEALDVWTRLETLYPEDERVQEQIAVTLVEEGAYGLALPRYEKLATLVKDDYRKVMYQIEAAELKIRENRRTDGLADYESMLENLNPTGWLFRDVRRRIEQVFLRAGDQDGLVKYYEKWIESNPEDVGGMARLAKFLASSARVPEATSWMEKALKLAPTRTDLRKTFIDQLIDDQRYDEACKQYESLAKSAPSNQDFLREWGRLVMKNKKLEPENRKLEAIKIWNRIVATRPDDALTNAQVADLYRQSELVEEAIALYKKAIELSPKDPQYREYLGEYYHILKRSDEAQATWSAIAADDRHSSVNVARLAEVYNSFGYLDQAVEQIAEACRLEPKEFTLHARASEYHMRAGKYDEAFKFIDNAAKLAENDEQLETVLRGRIEVFQTSRKLDEEIDRLEAELNEKKDASEVEWHTLARYFEADRRWADATVSIEKALAIEPKSILALTTSARIAKLAGDYATAANKNRKLAEVDRRSRSEHLMNVARLESQMGRSDEALAAGRDLIVSAPGNTDNYQFYAQLCFQLGKNDEALNTLRKAVRINPTEPQLTMALGSALSKEFRTDEAIEVYWRAFEKSDDIDDKTTLTQKLAQLYEQINQFDKLTERFERDQREESKRREMTICLAQAHQSSGDFGAARRELESLLSTDTRDTNLLQQLSKLCEAASDTDEAVNYQRQLADIAPSHETQFRLAKLLQARGDMDEASEILVELTRREEDPYRLLRSLDSLMKQQSFESVIAVTEPLLSESRDNWELLYREAAAYALMEKIPEAKLRFERLLSFNFPHDKLGVGAAEKLKREQAKARSNNLRGIQSQMPQRRSPFSLLSSSTQVQRATGISVNNSYNSTPEFWTPDVYGLARMASFGWLLQFEENEDTSKEARSGEDDEPAKTLVEQVAEKAAEEGADRDLIYDWMYVEQLKSNYKTLFEISKELAKDGGKEEQQYFLNSLTRRGLDASSTSSARGSKSKKDPLSDEELELMLACFKAVNAKDNNGAQSALAGGQIAYGSNGQAYVNIGGRWVEVGGGMLAGLGGVLNELKLAERTEQMETLLNEKIEAAQTAPQIASMMSVMWNQERFDEIPEMFSKWTAAAAEEIALAPNSVVTTRGSSANKNQHSAAQVQKLSQTLMQWTGKLAEEEENDQIMKIMDQAFDLLVQEGRKRRLQLASKKRKARSMPQSYQFNMQTYYGKTGSYVQIQYPSPNTYVDRVGLSILRQTFEVLKRNDVVEDLPKRLRERVENAEKAKSDDLLYEQLMLGYVLWWADEKDESVEVLTSASEKLNDDISFRFEMAQLQEQLGDYDAALEIVETIMPRDQKLLQQRELAALQLAERLGDIDRARAAAERLFGLRLDTGTQVKLVGQMKRLGLIELSEAVVSRMQRRSGNQISAMGSLMSLYQGQGKTDLAEQIANRIMQRTKSTLASATNSSRNPFRYGRSGDSAIRTQALALLRQTGALKKNIERVEEQLERAPDSPRFYEQLIEYYEATSDAEKVKGLLERAIEARPESMAFRYKLAKHFESNAKPSEACDQYLVILEKNPRWITDDFYQVRRVFQQAKRNGDLLEKLEGINLKLLGHPSNLINSISNMMSSGGTEAEADTEAVAKLFERVFEAFPSYRSNMTQYMRNEKFWKNDRMFEIGLKSLIPGKNTTLNPWQGIGNIYSYSGNGEVTGTFHQIINGVKGTKKEEVLRDAITKALEEHPAWVGGRAMLALIDLKRNKKLEAKQQLTKIFDDEEVFKTMPVDAGWIIGQELDKFEDTRELAVKIFEKGLSGIDSNRSNQIQYSPVARLVKLYSEVGRKDDARKLLLDRFRKANDSQYDQAYANYQRVESVSWVGGKLSEMGFHLDALLLYRETLDDKAGFRDAERYGGSSYEERIRAGMKTSLKAVLKENPEEAMGQLMSSNSPDAKVKTGAPSLDLLVSVPDTTTFRKESFSSQLFSLIDSLAGTKKGKQALLARVEKLGTENPDDLSTKLVKAYVTVKYSPEDAAETIQQLEEFLAAHPLEPIPEGRRPNSRQRREAKLATHVWLVSRECLKSKEHVEAGNRLAEFALLGARRQVGNDHVVSILHDWGKAAIANDNKELAEQKWSEMLELVTQRPKSKKKKPAAKGPGLPAPPPRKTGQNRRTVPGGNPRSLVAVVEAVPVNRMKNIFVSYVQEPQAMPAVAQKDDKEQPKEKPTGNRTPPLLLSQFKVAIQIAHVATENDMPELARRAIQKSMAGGLPVPDPDFSGQSSLGGVVFSPQRVSQNVANIDPIQREVAVSLDRVVRTWKGKEDYPPSEVYELLWPLVFPESRITEIMMYPDSSSINNAKVSSLGVALVQWASDAKKLDELSKLIAARKVHDPAKFPAAVMETHVSIVKEDFVAAKRNIIELAAMTEASTVNSMIMLSCHAAIPASEYAELEPEAIQILRKAINAQFATNQSNSSLGALATKVNAFLVKQGDIKAVEKFFEQYMVTQQRRYADFGGDYALYQQWSQSARIANAAAETGVISIAMDYLGRVRDFSYRNYGTPDTSKALLATTYELRGNPAVDRYKKWHEWTMPAEGRETIRTINQNDTARSSLAPEPFREKNKNVGSSEVNFLSNVFELVDAAKEAGKVDELLGEAKAAFEKELPNSDFLYIMLLISKNDLETAKPLIEKWNKTIKERFKNKQGQPTPNLWNDYVVCQACLQQSPEFAELFRQGRSSLEEMARGRSNVSMVTGLKTDFAVRRAEDLQASNAVGADPQLLHWASISKGSFDSWWVKEGESLTHLSGPSEELLCFKYPVVGDFKFSFDAFNGSWAEADGGYGGVFVECNSQKFGATTYISSFDSADTIQRPLSKKTGDNDFGRMTIECKDGRLMYSSNGRLAYEEKLSGTAPWIILKTEGPRTSAYRNFKFEGEPIIPREVNLFAGNRMDGWDTRFFKESRPLFRILAEKKKLKKEQGDSEESANPETEKEVEYAFNVEESVLSAKGNLDSPKKNQQSWVRYKRPLLEGESFSYEFFYTPGEAIANPTIGRIAIVIDDNQVGEHWIASTSQDRMLFGVETDNLITESEYAQEKSSGLNADDWNSVTVAFTEGELGISVNQKLIYKRPADSVSDASFGLFRYQHQLLKVRNAVLKGDWPEELNAEIADDLLASERTYTTADRKLISEMIADRFILPEIVPMAKVAKTLEAPAAYEKLKEWVLPNESRDGFRMYFKFPSREIETESTGSLGRDRRIISPAAELVQIALKANKLDELIDEIQQYKSKSALDKKSKNAMLVLAAIASDDEAIAKQPFLELYQSLEELGSAVAEVDRSPEMMVSWFSAGKPKFQSAARDIVRLLKQQFSSTATAVHKRRTRALLGRLEALAVAPKIEPSPLKQWDDVGWEGTSTSIAGYRCSHWQLEHKGVLEHVPGESRSLLMFKSPLQGKFQIEADMTLQEDRSGYLFYGFHGARVAEGGSRVKSRPIFRSASTTSLRPSVPNSGGSGTYRVEVDGSTLTTFVNDVQINETVIDGLPDPWVGLFPDDAGNGVSVRNLRITGEPSIPAELNLSETDMEAWNAGHFSEGFAQNSEGNWGWFKNGDELVGRVLNPNPDSESSGSVENLLVYHRPFLEDGEFEFESFYQAGTFECHPAIGMACFFVKPEGVSLKQISMGQQDEKIILKPNSEADPVKVALKENDWNKFLVKVEGNHVTLSVNGDQVYDYDLVEPLVERSIGLFRYGDKFESRIRRMRYRGDWPKELPSVEDQELAFPVEGILAVEESKSSDSLVVNLKDPKKVSEADGFSLKGPEERLLSSDDGTVFELKDASEYEHWPGFTYSKPVVGDFDLTADFSGLEIESFKEGWGIGFELEALLDDSQETTIAIGVFGDKDGNQFLKGMDSHLLPTNKRGYQDYKRNFIKDTGTMRLAKRGKKIYCLFAPEDGDFELVDSFIVGDANVKEIRLSSKTSDKAAKLSVKSKQITLTTYSE